MDSLWQTCAKAGGVFHTPSGTVAVRDFAGDGLLSVSRESLRGRCVLLSTHDQLPTALALLALDGVASRLVLCTPDLTPAQLTEVALTADADAIVVDAAAAQRELPDVKLVTLLEAPDPNAPRKPSVQRTRPPQRDTAAHATEWVLLTSGTTGQPKLVVHSLESLAGTLPRQVASVSRMVWSTFYDIRRYGGLQIYLRAMIAGTGLVLSQAGEPVPEFLARAARAGVTHISGTPSHWRRALMSGETALIDPDYVRLSGEVADQTILDGLRMAYPRARIAHAFASTEAGVAFDVNDGVAGFPREVIDGPHEAIELKVDNGTLWVRSKRIAARYLGGPTLPGEDGYIDTGDHVELVGERYHFRGRAGGVINVGGLKVHPEEVEAVLNADERVRMSRVTSKRSPITGAVIVAEVVLREATSKDSEADILKAELLEVCRKNLAKHKVPALLRFVPTLEMTAAGKLVRPNA